MMSGVPTKEINGDVSVGRNVVVGGAATVRGSMKVGHNLKIDGWLEAANIKGPNKGLFSSETKLNEAYPTPIDGWWALVGNSLPAQMYIASGGVWIGQTKEDGSPVLGGNPTIDCEEYLDMVEELSDELGANRERLTALEERLTNHESMETPSGGNGLGMLVFSGFVANASLSNGSAVGSYEVVYVESLHRFAARSSGGGGDVSVGPGIGGVSGGAVTLYENWPTRDEWLDADNKPRRDRLFVCDGIIYYSDNEGLKQINNNPNWQIMTVGEYEALSVKDDEKIYFLKA